jgi:hypothetical protein
MRTPVVSGLLPKRGAVVGEYLVGILRADQGTLGRNVIGVWPAPDGDGGEERLPTRIQSIRSPTGRAGTEERGDVAGRVRRDLIVLAASLAVFAVCAVVVADGRVGSAERAVFHAVNGLPGWLYRPMLVAQYLGVLAMPLVVAVGALSFRRWRLAAALVLVVPLKLAAEKVVKQLVQRERPGTTVPDALLRGVHPGGLSFVSGHAITKENPGCWTRRRTFAQVRHGSNIQLLPYSLVGGTGRDSLPAADPR